MSKDTLTEQEIKRFAKLSGVEVAPEPLVEERRPRRSVSSSREAATSEAPEKEESSSQEATGGHAAAGASNLSEPESEQSKVVWDQLLNLPPAPAPAPRHPLRGAQRKPVFDGRQQPRCGRPGCALPAPRRPIAAR